MKDADRLLSIGKQTPMENFSQVASKVDLDDDGEEDWIVFAGATGMVVRHVVYVMRGSCGHRVADITANANLELADGKSRGLRELTGESACPVTCCPRVTVYKWRFDGRAYRQASKKVQAAECADSSPF